LMFLRAACDCFWLAMSHSPCPKIVKIIRILSAAASADCGSGARGTHGGLAP
jgi:hypothetical protein